MAMVDATDAEIQVIIVAYGSPLLLDACLEGLGGQFPIIVVDNASSTSTRAVVEKHGACYLDPGENLGFGAGVNRALIQIFDVATDEQKYPDVLLLNPDAIIGPDVVRHLHRVLTSESDLAAVAPSQHRPDCSIPERVCWPFPSPMNMWLEAIGLGCLRQKCQFLIGAILLVRGATLYEVGGFDEQFYLYAEETDWQRRVTRAGWRVGYCPEVVAVHVGAGTDSDTVRREIRFHAAHERYIRKWFGRSGWYSFRLAHVVGALIRVILCRGDQQKSAWNRLALYVRSPDSVAKKQLVFPIDDDPKTLEFVIHNSLPRKEFRK